MLETNLRVESALFLAVLGLSLAHCGPGSAEDDDGDGSSGNETGGASGLGGASGTATGGVMSGGTGGTSTGGASTGGASTGGTSSSGAGGGASSCDNPMPVTTRGPAPAPIDEATFKSQWPSLACAAMRPGCDAAGVAYVESACLAHAATALDDTLAYDAVEAALCLEALRESTYSTTTMSSYLGRPAPCYYVYRGALALGAACDDDEECAPDPRGPVRCDLLTSVCTVAVRGKLGDACHNGCELATDGTCHRVSDLEVPGVEVTCHNEDGLYCDGFESRCEPSIPTGCTCFLGAGEYCNAEADCTEGLDAVCVPRHNAGEPCTINANCVRSTYCPLGTPAVCTPRKHAGEACSEHDECLGAYCIDGACMPDSGVTRGPLDEAYCAG